MQIVSSLLSSPILHSFRSPSPLARGSPSTRRLPPPRAMSQRKTGHDQFRNLFKNQSTEQTAVRVAGSQQPSRSRSSAKASSVAAQSRRRHDTKGTPSTKSIKRKSGGRSKASSTDKSSGSRKKSIGRAAGSPKETSRKSNGRAKTPARTPQATTPTTPDARTAGSIPGSPKRSRPSTKYNGQDVQEKTEMQNTVFENDVTAGQTTAGGGEMGGGPQIKMAEARIKARKLQWKKDEGSPDPKKQQESSANDGDKYEKKYGAGAYGKGEIRHEANNTIKDRTIFENDGKGGKPAEVKEEKAKLQWAPGAKPDEPPAKPRRGIPAMPSTNATSITGSPPKENVAEKLVSCYIAPTLQHAAFNSAEMLKKEGALHSEPYEAAKPK